jgi:hypothetical protein
MGAALIKGAPRIKNPGSAVEALAGECNEAIRSQVVLKYITDFASGW